jgi:hypothetical protein
MPDDFWEDADDFWDDTPDDKTPLKRFQITYRDGTKPKVIHARSHAEANRKTQHERNVKDIRQLR